MAKELSDKQRMFVAEYLKDLNATQAAARAGYSPKTSNEQGARLLANASVAASIQEAMAERTKRTEITADYVLSSLQKVAERCMTAVPVLEKVDGEWVESGEYRFDSSGANRALELIGKNIGMFKDKIEHSGPNGGPIDANITVTFVNPDGASGVS